MITPRNANNKRVRNSYRWSTNDMVPSGLTFRLRLRGSNGIRTVHPGLGQQTTGVNEYFTPARTQCVLERLDFGRLRNRCCCTVCDHRGVGRRQLCRSRLCDRRACGRRIVVLHFLDFTLEDAEGTTQTACCIGKLSSTRTELRRQQRQSANASAALHP